MNEKKDLTEREKEVLVGISIVGNRKAAAKLLNIEKTTVDKHVEAIFKKFGVHEISSAILFSLYYKILDLNNLVKALLTRKYD